MRRIFSLLICIGSMFQLFSQETDQLLKQIDEMHASKTGLFKDYNDLKFGMFIHWGIYSKLGGVWKGVNIVNETHGWPSTQGEWIIYSSKIPRQK